MNPKPPVTTQVVEESAASSEQAAEAMREEMVAVEPPTRGGGLPTWTTPERTSRLLLGSVLVGLAAMVAAFGLLRFANAPLSVPFDYDGDASFYLMEIQGLHEHGSYLSNPDLGYPFGQDTRDLPQGADNLNWLTLRVLSLAGGAAVAMNLFYLLSFGFIAGVAFAVLRLLGVRSLVAAVGSGLYAFLPYHLLRRGGHLLLSSYALIPLAVLFALVILSDDPPISVGSGLRPRLRFGRRGLLVLAACAAMGSLGAYYAVFSVLLFMAAGVTAAIARRWWRPLWSGLALSVTVGVVMVLNVVPSIWYRIRHGANPEAIVRYPAETELYGLRIQQLFSPRIYHRNATLARLGSKAYSGPIPSEYGQSLGVLAGAGLALLLATVLVGMVASTGPWWDRPPVRLLRQAGMLAVVVILTATISGFAYFLSAAGMRDIRAWNRSVVVLGFLGVLALAVVAEAWARRMEARRGRRWTSVALAIGAVAVLLVGWYDQTSPADVRGGLRATWESDRDLFGGMADALPAGTPVFQLPVVEFPEVPPVVRTQAYDEARAYLHAPSLRWSFGSVRGRHPDWPAGLDQRDGPALVAYLRDAGFRAVVVDRFGYEDAAADLEARLATAAPRRGESRDGRYAWYELGEGSGG